MDRCLNREKLRSAMRIEIAVSDADNGAGSE